MSPLLFKLVLRFISSSRLIDYASPSFPKRILSMCQKIFQEVNITEIKVQIEHQILTWKPSPDFALYDGSAIIARVTEGGLAAFQVMTSEQQTVHRQLAIDTIRQECIETGRIGVVAGHYMFYSELQMTPEIVGTPNDLATFTHILYLDVPAETVAQRRRDDSSKQRGHLHVERLKDWKVKEQEALRKVCRENNILFSILSGLSPTLVTDVCTMLREFQSHAQPRGNSKTVEVVLEKWLRSAPEHLETVMVLDGDKTLAPHDTGTMFWQAAKAMEADLAKVRYFLSIR